MTNSKSTIRGTLPELKFRPCCLLADLVFPSNIPVFGFLWPKIMKDLSAPNLKHVSGISLWGFILRREHSGTVYTCKGGFIDLGHLRDFVDLTRWYYYALKKLITKKGEIKAGTTFPIFKTHGKIEGKASIRKDLQIIDEDSTTDLILLARLIAYDVSVMYEIQTYYSKGIGDRHSSFSPEDLTSNFLGTYVGGKAIKSQIELAKKENLKKDEANATFDHLVTLELIVLLSKLDAVDVDKTLKAYGAINKKWIKEGLIKLVDLLNSDYLQRRNFDVTPVTPWLVEGFSDCSNTSFPSEIELAIPDKIRGMYEAQFKVPFTKTERDAESKEIHKVTEYKYFSSDKFNEYINEVKVLAEEEYGANFNKP